MEEDHTKILRWLPWSGGRRLVCSIRTYREKTALDIRLHYFDPEMEDWRPTKNGLWVPIEKANDFRELIIEAFARLSTYGDEKTQPSGDSVLHPLAPNSGKSEQPSEDQSDSQEDDSEIENSGQLGKNDTDADDDPEQSLNDWLGRQ